MVILRASKVGSELGPGVRDYRGFGLIPGAQKTKAIRNASGHYPCKCSNVTLYLQGERTGSRRGQTEVH